MFGARANHTHGRQPWPLLMVPFPKARLTYRRFSSQAVPKNWLDGLDGSRTSFRNEPLTFSWRDLVWSIIWMENKVWKEGRLDDETMSDCNLVVPLATLKLRQGNIAWSPENMTICNNLETAHPVILKSSIVIIRQPHQVKLISTRD